MFAVLNAVWQSDTISPEWTKGWRSLSCKGKGIARTVISIVVLGYQFSGKSADADISTGMLAANVCLKKAFGLVHRESLWDLLRLHGIHTMRTVLLTGLITGTKTPVRCMGDDPSLFPMDVWTGQQPTGKAVDQRMDH